MVFGFFKKKKKEEEEQGPHYDPLRIKITDLRKGFILDYNMKTWIVEDEYEYDWGDHYFSYEYRLKSGSEEFFLSIDADDDLVLMVMKKIKVHRLGTHIEDEILKNGRPPAKITYEGRDYFREKENPGFFRNTANASREESVEVIIWDYFDDTEKYVMTVEQWGDREFEAAVGEVVPEYEFNNILPNS